MNRLFAMIATSTLAALLLIASLLVSGFSSPLTWLTIAAWAIADTALVFTVVGDVRARQRNAGAAAARTPAERRAAAHLAESIDSLVAARMAAPGASVVLLSPGPNKIAVIKVLRQHLNTGLREAKDLVEATGAGPAVVALGLKPEAAARLLRELHEAGARAELR
jgi:ribosomal protein L7/L12